MMSDEDKNTYIPEFSDKNIASLRPSKVYSETQTFAAPKKTTNKKNIFGKMSNTSVWIWAVISFIVAFAITAGVLGGINPPAVQQIDALGNANGTIDFYKVFGGAAVVGLTVLVIYLLIVLSKSDSEVHKASSSV